MPFIAQKNGDGLIWVPAATRAAGKKHNCPDCESCQHCADSRCRVCLRRRSCQQKHPHAPKLPPAP